MNRIKTGPVARSLKVLPAVVLLVAALFQARTLRELVRARPGADAVMMLAAAGPTRHVPSRRLTRRELDAREAARRAIR